MYQGSTPPKYIDQVVISMSCVGAYPGYGGGMQAAAFVLVLFILLVIILRAGIF